MSAPLLCAALFAASVAAVGFACVGWGSSWRRTGGGDLWNGPV
ncbi:hypothetical protein AB0B50_01415 [Streptomyces sp. NPDC041068]